MKRGDDWGLVTDPSDWNSILEPAPGDLRIVQAFVNTVDIEMEADTFADPRALADWLTRWRLLSPGTELDENDLERARDVREGLRALLRVNTGMKRDEKAVERLDRATASAHLRMRFTVGGGRGVLEPARSGFDEACARLLALVTAAQLDGSWPRFKACVNPICGRAFFDLSRSRTGRWCTVRRCGNRINARKFRKRRPARAKTYRAR